MRRQMCERHTRSKHRPVLWSQRRGSWFAATPLAVCLRTYVLVCARQVSFAQIASVHEEIRSARFATSLSNSELSGELRHGICPVNHVFDTRPTG